MPWMLDTVFSLISQSTLKSAGFIRWQFRACFLACASSRLWSVMAMICCRTSPVLEPGGGPGGERRGAGGGGAGRGGRWGASMSCGCSTRSWGDWRARADVVANCCRPCAPRAHSGAPPLASAYGQPPPGRRWRPAQGHAPTSPSQRPRTLLEHSASTGRMLSEDLPCDASPNQSESSQAFVSSC